MTTHRREDAYRLHFDGGNVYSIDAGHIAWCAETRHVEGGTYDVASAFESVGDSAFVWITRGARGRKPLTGIELDEIRDALL